MANICGFSMRVRGQKNDIEKFYNAMQQKGNVYMGRGADAEIEYEDEDEYSIGWIQGWCKWSVVSALVDNAISMRTEPNRWYFGDDVDTSKIEFVTLIEACKKYNLDMEVFSEEPGCCFQEHIMIIDGDVIIDDCAEWIEYDLDEFDTKEEAEEALEIEITDEEWSDGGFISRGGFGEWEFEI